MGAIDRFAAYLASGLRGAASRLSPQTTGNPTVPTVQPSANPALTAPSAVLPGVSRWGTGMGANTSPELAASMRDVAAYLGRVSYDAGPANTRFSSYPANDLTPEKILAAQHEAINGYPLHWAEMIEQILGRDSHLAGIAQQRVDDVIKGTWRLTTPKNLSDRLTMSIAACVRSFCDEQLRDVPDFEDALGWLLWSNAYGYNANEVTWQRKRVIFPGPNGQVIGPVEVVVPARLDAVHPKHFRFELRTDEPLLWVGADQISLPPGKFVFVRGEGNNPITERRGYMWQCVWLSLLKSIGASGWAVFVERFGMPVPIVFYDGDIAQYNEYKAAYDDILDNLGSGKGAVIPRGNSDLDIKNPAQGGTAGGPHSALWDACEAGQSVRVLGATLTAKIGNVGSFSASSAHLEVKYAKEESDARRTWAAVRSQLLDPMVRFNAEVLAAVIGDALGVAITPDVLMRCVPYGMHRVPREVDPTQRIDMLAKAVNQLGARISAENLYDEFNFAQPVSDDDVLPGEATPVTKGGALVGNVEAATIGVKNEDDNSDRESAAGGKVATGEEATGGDAERTARGAEREE